MKYTIYLDFDGTVVEHDYPIIGRPNYGCIEVIKKLQDAGHDIIINTYRADLATSEKGKKLLNSALHILNEIPYAILKDKRNMENFELKPFKWLKKKFTHLHGIGKLINLQK